MTTTCGEGEDLYSKAMIMDLENDVHEYLNYNDIVTSMNTAFGNGAGALEAKSKTLKQNKQVSFS